MNKTVFIFHHLASASINTTFIDNSYMYNVRLYSFFNINVSIGHVRNNHFLSIVHPDKSLILYVCKYGYDENLIMWLVGTEDIRFVCLLSLGF